MKFEINRKIIAAILISAFAAFGLACQNRNESNSAAKPVVSGEGGTTPTDAYIKLYTAVKAKQPDAIKAIMSEKTIGFAQFASQRQNQSFEKVIENGFTMTTFADTIPEIRDERIKDDAGSVEVYNAKESRWEDLPFVKETNINFRASGSSKNNVTEIVRNIKGINYKENGDAIEGSGKVINRKEAEDIKNKLTEAGAEVELTYLGWKFALGDLFGGTFQSPGKGRAQLESEAANVNGNNLVPINPTAQSNINPGKIIKPVPEGKTKVEKK